MTALEPGSNSSSTTTPPAAGASGAAPAAPATTTGVRPPVEPYQEHDKLGPLAAPMVATPPGLPIGDAVALRAAVLASFHAAIEGARAAAAEVTSDPIDAVHSYRKHLRRAHAVTRLVEDALSTDDRPDVSAEVRDARRALSEARDHAVAPGVLTALALEDDARATADAVIAAAATAMTPAAELRALLERGVTRVTTLGDVLATGLPVELAWDVVVDGVADTYRRGRKWSRKSKKSLTAAHAWRRRAKELSYQLELVSGGANGRVEDLRRGFSALGEELGAVVDLTMTRGYVERYGAGLEPDAIAALVGVLDAEIAKRLKSARKQGRKVFAGGGRRLARKLARAARKDRKVKASSDGAAAAADVTEDEDQVPEGADVDAAAATTAT